MINTRFKMSGLRWILVLLLPPGYACDSYDEWADSYGRVEHVSVFFRHGIRTPLEIYPTDPHGDPAVWPLGYGELTKEGVRQHYVLGSWLGERYSDLLPPNRNYNRSVITVLSSQIDRCIMSAAANMAGMFPLSRERNWGGINWYPVPIHSIPTEFDNLIQLSRPCKKYIAEFLKFNTSEEYRQILDRFKDVLDFSELMSGLDKMEVHRFMHLYDTLYIESLYGLPLPLWTREIYPQAMAELVGIGSALPTWTDLLKRLKCGFLLKTLLEKMKWKLNGTLLENISVYSGHDSTIACLLNSMGVFDFDLPPFASSVLLELRRIPGCEPVLMIFYKKSPELRIDPKPLCLPGCPFACPLSTLEALWAPLLVQDWEKECEV
ncbi:hypothetical protein GE061_010789 [Apolygus lucorum]|uniref:acid phosphatase n=1 Tax=Apolygus lucorum TaxID=248454 RepID=A0A6A4INX7_APOLU|nr:hypothetical protein GE061_010789 [Apolygus lucorum]